MLLRRAEPSGRVGRELGGRTDRRVRRIEIDEVAGPAGVERLFEPAHLQAQPRASKRTGQPFEVGLVADPDAGVAPRGHVEISARVDAKQPVVAGPVQVDQHRGELGGVGRRIEQISTKTVEVPVAHGIEMRRPVAPMPFREPLEAPDHVVHGIPHHAVAADHIRVDVGQPHRAAVQQPMVVAVEEHGAAADEWFHVPLER